MATSERWSHKFQIKNTLWVFVPNKNTRLYGKQIKCRIEKLWVKPDYYFHLRNGGHVESLKIHLKNTYFIHVDIQSFFENINKSRVTRNLKNLVGYKAARLIAEESTVQCPNSNSKKYILPFGFVQSPILASLCLHKSRLGVYLDTLRRSDDIEISVYMDDIIVSGCNLSELEEILKKLHSISVHSGFPLNETKTQISSSISSFNIEVSHMKLVISKQRMLEFLEAFKNGNVHQRRGIVSYIFSVH